MKKAKTVTKKTATKRKEKKVEQMQELRENTTRSSSGSTKWTTGDEIRFLRSARELLAERKYDKKSLTPWELENVPDYEMSSFFQKYIQCCRNRVNWPAMDKETILEVARKLLRDHI